VEPWPGDDLARLGRVDDDGPVSAELRRADIKVVDSSKDGLSCVGACPFEGMLIAAENGHGHPTKGDSGGPLVTFDAQGPIVVGIYSAEMLGSHYYMRTARDPFSRDGPRSARRTRCELGPT
jgi:hypothetical protein